MPYQSVFGQKPGSLAAPVPGAGQGIAALSGASPGRFPAAQATPLPTPQQGGVAAPSLAPSGATPPPAPAQAGAGGGGGLLDQIDTTNLLDQIDTSQLGVTAGAKSPGPTSTPSVAPRQGSILEGATGELGEMGGGMLALHILDKIPGVDAPAWMVEAALYGFGAATGKSAVEVASDVAHGNVKPYTDYLKTFANSFKRNAAGALVGGAAAKGLGDLAAQQGSAVAEQAANSAGELASNVMAKQAQDLGAQNDQLASQFGTQLTPDQKYGYNRPLILASQADAARKGMFVANQTADMIHQYDLIRGQYPELSQGAKGGAQSSTLGQGFFDRMARTREIELGGLGREAAQANGDMRHFVGGQEDPSFPLRDVLQKKFGLRFDSMGNIMDGSRVAPEAYQLANMYEEMRSIIKPRTSLSDPASEMSQPNNAGPQFKEVFDDNTHKLSFLKEQLATQGVIFDGGGGIVGMPKKASLGTQASIAKYQRLQAENMAISPVNQSVQLNLQTDATPSVAHGFDEQQLKPPTDGSGQQQLGMPIPPNQLPVPAGPVQDVGTTIQPGAPSVNIGQQTRAPEGVQPPLPGGGFQQPNGPNRFLPPVPGGEVSRGMTLQEIDSFRKRLQNVWQDGMLKSGDQTAASKAAGEAQHYYADMRDEATARAYEKTASNNPDQAEYYKNMANYVRSKRDEFAKTRDFITQMQSRLAKNPTDIAGAMVDLTNPQATRDRLKAAREIFTPEQMKQFSGGVLDSLVEPKLTRGGSLQSAFGAQEVASRVAEFDQALPGVLPELLGKQDYQKLNKLVSLASIIEKTPKAIAADSANNQYAKDWLYLALSQNKSWTASRMFYRKLVAKAPPAFQDLVDNALVPDYVKGVTPLADRAEKLAAISQALKGNLAKTAASFATGHALEPAIDTYAGVAKDSAVKPIMSLLSPTQAPSGVSSPGGGH